MGARGPLELERLVTRSKVVLGPMVLLVLLLAVHLTAGRVDASAAAGGDQPAAVEALADVDGRRAARLTEECAGGSVLAAAVSRQEAVGRLVALGAGVRTVRGLKQLLVLEETSRVGLRPAGGGPDGANRRVALAEVHRRPLREDGPRRIPRNGRPVQVREIGHRRLVAQGGRGCVEVAGRAAGVALLLLGGRAGGLVAVSAIAAAGLAPGDDSVALVALSDRIVEDAKLLGDEVDNSALAGREGAGEGELVAHPVLLEDEDARVDVKRRRVVEVELGRLGRDSAGIAARVAAVDAATAARGDLDDRDRRIGTLAAGAAVTAAHAAAAAAEAEAERDRLNVRVAVGHVAAECKIAHLLGNRLRAGLLQLRRDDGAVLTEHHGLRRRQLLLLLLGLLDRPHAPKSLLALDALLLASLKNLLVLDAELAAADVVSGGRRLT